ncbi:MAG: hypothetical protein EBR10_01075 [Planctomycetes bacterium]|nr:hypothetical protein [Planctomycetota bacterium]
MTKVVRKLDLGARGRHVAAPQRGRATGGPAPAEPAVGDVGRVPRISVLMALAIRFDGLLRDGTVPNLTDLTELARLAHVTQPRMTQIMNLLHLAPDIQEALLHLGPVTARGDSITERDLRRIAATTAWSGQRAVWKKLRRSERRPIHEGDAPLVRPRRGTRSVVSR